MFFEGKSSLLNAILGEMEKKSGTIEVRGSIGYVSQQAWIRNATVRENILFGREMEEKWYKKVLQSCCLGPDLKSFPAGDLTEVRQEDNFCPSFLIFL